jgi:hypothetical protein
MAVFQQQMEDRLADDTLAYLREDHADALTGVPEDILRRRVRDGLRRAKTYGIESDVSFQIFVAMMFDLGPHFDSHPVVARLLRDPSLPADERLDALVFEASDRVWDEMAILSGGDLWDDEREEPPEIV